jgi:hypothetical protein
MKDENLDDIERSASRAIGHVSPKAIAEAMEDPSVFEQVARGDLYVEMGRLRRLAASPSFPVAHRLEYTKMLSKMGKVEKPEETGSAGSGFSITINLPSGQNISLQQPKDITPEQPVIEHQRTGSDG